MSLGYDKNLFILPFDHRTSMIELLGFTTPQLSSQEREIVMSIKEIIFAAFEKAVEQDIPKDQSAILIDEEYGDKIIRDALSKKYNVILSTEKSGQKEFAFEYGDDFEKHIEKYKPKFVKALIHYNPNDDPLSKMRQQQKLQILSNYCHQKSYKFLLELLISPTEMQLKEVGGNKNLFEASVRPNLTAKTIEELQNVGIEPDVWKIEGMEYSDSYKVISLQARKGDRGNVGIVILGRAQTQDKVDKWIKAGNNINGVIGFAVGRTVFWEPLINYKNGNIDKSKAIETICNNFIHFYNVFLNEI